jgi:DNA repair exonuclease SbcCD nuclease subunit
MSSSLFQFSSKTNNSEKDKNKYPIRFLHASDIHLGAHQFYNNDRANDFIHAFKEILALAKFHSVNFIILGGDVFTSLEILPGKLNKIVNILKRFIELTEGTIPIIAIEGNHDIRKFSRGSRVKRGQSWLKFIHQLGLIILLDTDLENSPDNLYPSYNFATKQGGKIIVNNVTIYGNHYVGQTPREYIRKIYDSIDGRDSNFKILIQHFGIEGQMENVPGLKYKTVLPLRKKIDYLALGHFHKQYVIDNWIFNPGSSEAACSVDSLYKRGVFLIEINKDNMSKSKIKVFSINLNNRKFVWKTIYLKTSFRDFERLSDYIINNLKRQKDESKMEEPQINAKSPILCLRLEGIKPRSFSSKKSKNLCSKICENLGFLDVKLYQKFHEPFTTIDNFICQR